VVVVDDFTGRADAWREAALRLAPFPPASGPFYPGLRRQIDVADTEANALVDSLMRAAAPFIGGAFDCDRLSVLQASFSMVTARAEALSPRQRAPHFDSVDRKYIAVLLYLTEGTGTAFYRHRATGIEQVTQANLSRYVSLAEAENLRAPREGYIIETDEFYIQTGKVASEIDRVVIYQGAVLHSGLIYPDLALSADPGIGRLTVNIFVQGR
jgi:hypothetical protein